MKTIQPTNGSPKLIREVHVARGRLAQAESKLATAKDQARLARQWRKAAKLAARFAKQQVKLAKAEVAGAELALALREARLAQLNLTAIPTKPRNGPRKQAVVAPRPKKTAARTILSFRVSPVGQAAKKLLAVPNDLETPIPILPPEVSKATIQIIKGVEELFTAKTTSASTFENSVSARITTAPQI